VIGPALVIGGMSITARSRFCQSAAFHSAAISTSAQRAMTAILLRRCIRSSRTGSFSPSQR